MISKKILLPVLVAVVIGGVAVFGVGVARAQDSNSTPFAGLAQALAQKFGLDQAQVQTAVADYMSQHRQNRQQNMQQREEDHLNKLVQDGKITDAQKQAILTELAALRSKYNPDTFKDKTADERKQQMQAMKDELQAWAKQQGIDLKYVLPGMGVRAHMKTWVKNAPTSSPTP